MGDGGFYVGEGGFYVGGSGLLWWQFTLVGDGLLCHDSITQNYYLVLF